MPGRVESILEPPPVRVEPLPGKAPLEEQCAHMLSHFGPRYTSSSDGSDPSLGTAAVSAITFSVEQDAGRTVVALEGELDIAAVTQVEPELDRIERGEPPLLVLDLRGVTFLDSSGIRMILAADARAREGARRLILIRGPEPVHRVFELALLDRRLEFVDDPPAVGAR